MPTPRRVALSFSLTQEIAVGLAPIRLRHYRNINNSVTSFRLGRDKHHPTLALTLISYDMR